MSEHHRTDAPRAHLACAEPAAKRYWQEACDHNPSEGGPDYAPDSEHGGDAESVKFCHRAGMDYVSCSPFRIPVARLAAAQAAIEERGEMTLEK